MVAKGIIGIFGVLLVVAAVKDVKQLEIPLYYLIIASALVVCKLLFNFSFSVAEFGISCGVGILLLVVSIISRGSLGLSDSYLLLCIGAMIGIEKFSLVILYSFILSSICSGYLLVCKKVSKKYRIPFIPFICMGYVLALL